MAQVVLRVTGRLDGSRTSRTFRDTDAGRRAAKELAAELDGARTAYDVRCRIGGRVVTRTFKRRRDADAYAATIEADRLRGVAVDPRRARITFGELSDRWLRNRTGLAKRTAELYRWILDRHLGPTFGAVPVGDITPSSIRDWYAGASAGHPSTAAKAYRLLSAIMATAVTDELIVRNPCRVTGAGAEKSPERPVASIAEVTAAADAMPDHLRIAVLLAAWCQLRRGEVLGLQRQDVDLRHQLLHVERSRVVAMDGTEITKAPKSRAGRRTLAIPPNVLPALEGHLDRWVGAEPEAPLLVGEKGSPVRTCVLHGAWDKARRSVGRPDLRFHDLRHSGLTWLAASGATLREVMRRAGHASYTSALRYQHATDERDQVLAGALAELAARVGEGALAGAKARHSAVRDRP